LPFPKSADLKIGIRVFDSSFSCHYIFKLSLP
jgi:hypothetical protein